MKTMAVRLAALALCGITAVWAAPILTSSVTQTPEGYLYEYTLASDTPGQGIGILFLLDLNSYDELMIGSPTGWFITYPLGPHEMAWVAEDPSRSATSTNTVTGFSLSSQSPPGTGAYFVVYDEPDADGEIFAEATTLVPGEGPPAEVPEPAVGLWLGFLALLALPALARRPPGAKP